MVFMPRQVGYCPGELREVGGTGTAECQAHRWEGKFRLHYHRWSPRHRLSGYLLAIGCQSGVAGDRAHAIGIHDQGCVIGVVATSAFLF
jgi:hypothetical protein